MWLPSQCGEFSARWVQARAHRKGKLLGNLLRHLRAAELSAFFFTSHLCPRRFQYLSVSVASAGAGTRGVLVVPD